MHNIDRIRQLAGIQEAIQVEHPDDEDRRDDQQRAREIKIAKLIALAFRRIGLAIAEDGIFYMEDNREAIITLNDSEIDIEHLIALKASGLAKGSYVVSAIKDHDTAGLSVMFSVDPGLDHAVI